MSSVNQPLDQHSIGPLVEALLDQGSPTRHARHWDATQLAGLYQLGYTFYQQAKAPQAETIFRFLCLYDHLEPRHWLGLGACLQAQEQYHSAIAAYARAALLAPEDPNLPFYAGCCYQALGWHPQALAAFQTTQELADAQPQYRTLTERAALLSQTLSGAQTATPDTR